MTQAQSFVGLSAAGTSLYFYAAISSSPTTVPITGLGGDSLIGIDYFTSGNGVVAAGAVAVLLVARAAGDH